MTDMANAFDGSAAAAAVVAAAASPPALPAAPASRSGGARGSQQHAPVPTTTMLEFGFENLQWNHVVERASKSIATLEGVMGALRARATAEAK